MMQKNSKLCQPMINTLPFNTYILVSNKRMKRLKKKEAYTIVDALIFDISSAKCTLLINSGTWKMFVIISLGDCSVKIATFVSLISHSFFKLMQKDFKGQSLYIILKQRKMKVTIPLKHFPYCPPMF